MERVVRFLGGEPIVATYVFEVGGMRIAVDPGPASTLGSLEVDAVLCTHIHLDHCGSAGHLGKPAYVHERYVRHLVDPARLYEASLATLGVYAEVFGRPLPAREAVGVPDGARLFDAVDVFHTPGHAPHHVMYYYRDEKVLFVGDGAGVYIPELDVVIPTTPPPFRLQQYLESLSRVRGLDVDLLCFPHFACTRRVEILDVHREQIVGWVEALRDLVGGSVDDAVRAVAKVDENAAKVLQTGGLYADFFLRYSVAGLLDYLRSASSS
ncbi:MBL fold metallo-hydrolase [Pyrobaculum neutrophilum]|uniref:Beta-lactamase domain protein n=1 Tax=Pyrobaculum neutrophilum (strain DSM 2338 / JCM 9278 / NBRC 100436 / V24Sta) TaxID=444157 RepID=B1YCP7_PYRNV|nr:MBL fold metallo-hydrolase [Pyrobaculum neutrophilum]ACB39560.1 beta-lactamase domain protein [Pyrobaculum neutrophilum V24Sta]